MTKDVSQIEKNQESRPSEFVFVVYPVMERMVVTSIGIFLPFFFFRFVNEAWIPWIWLGSVALFWVLSGKFFEATLPNQIHGIHASLTKRKKKNGKKIPIDVTTIRSITG